MKTSGFLLTLLAAGMILTSFSDSGKNKASIKKGTLKINGHKMRDNWTLSSFTAILGQPDSMKDGYNKTHTYNQKGMVLFEKVRHGVPLDTIAEIQFYFSKGEVNNSVIPFYNYSGKFKVDKLDVTFRLTYSELKMKLKDWKETDSYMPHNHRLSKKGIYIYFQFNDDDSKLIKISIGKDKG